MQSHYETMIWIDTDDTLPEDIIFKKVVIVITCIIKDNSKFYQILW